MYPDLRPFVRLCNSDARWARAWMYTLDARAISQMFLAWRERV